MNNKQPISARYPDLLPEQDDPALLELVQDLDMLYTSQHIPARLTLPLAGDRPVLSEQLPVLLPPQPGTLAPSSPKRRSGWSHLNTLAAVLFTALLVGALLGTFVLVQRSGKSSATNNAAPCNASSSPKVSLGEMHMMTTSVGWARTEGSGGMPGNELLHSSDGGCDWQVVTPGSYSLTQVISYITGTSVWAVVTDKNHGKPFAARTSDGGRTWSYSALFPIPGDTMQPGLIEGASVTFLTPEIGWLIVNQYDKAIARYGLALYHTTNGGITWKELTNQVPVSVLWTVNIELGGAGVPVGMRFLNASTGWITGTDLTIGRSKGNGALLYVTHDGGLTWQEQELSLHCGMTLNAAETVTYPPQFFSERDGLLTASSWSPLGLCVYVTRDGGTTWQSTSFLPVGISNKIQVDRYSPTPVPQFVDTQFGWLWEGGIYQPSNMLVTTHDGGLHWTSSHPALPTAYGILQVQFVSPAVGWLLANKGAAPTALFGTVDGGKSWVEIHASTP